MSCEFETIHFNFETKGVNYEYWVPTIEYLLKNKDDINKFSQVVYILNRCVLFYLRQLISVNYTIDYLEMTKIFVRFLGYPNYFDEYRINMLILNCMNYLCIPYYSL
jgi:hypothetical protein